jgi:hypothetical protein
MGSWVEDFSMADSAGGSHLHNKRSPTKKEQIEVIISLSLSSLVLYYN